MSRPMSKMLIYTGIFFAILFGIYGVKKILFMWYMSHYQPPAVTISETTAKRMAWQSYLNAVGTLNAVNGVDLSSEAAGIIEELRFNSGQYVRKGDVILSMRSHNEQATLKNNQATLQLARINYEREKTLFDKHVSSKAALDSRYAELLRAQAGVESAQAQIQQKTITAPFDGRLGIRQVNLGQYVSPGTVLVTLQSLDPLYVSFSLPEQYLADLYLGQNIDVSVNFGKGKTVQGTITAINSKVEPSSRNVLVQATIPNPNYQLYPGMYGLVKIWLKKDKEMPVVVPQTAISYSLSGDYVFIIKNESDNKNEKNLHVYRQYVKVGERRDSEATILEGLKPGDSVVTSGQLKLQNGTRVVIDNSVELS
ncbi:Efflux pump periplasmic linker BepF [Aquicella siphonis]|uniref:Efflux pump periplasmic linker BepF n=1 Tax=Aquicella siphonis TaxID=254247 RepID=A0A5E4PGK6_9COXI|nr:efflux RND transporter periplasmic adaptor subunit [Aquicella siphonis]VVC76109.1 Efflux pump periplasmic linker BepF [Aquicella siphonis]